MAVSKEQFLQLFKTADLKKLFVQVLGWDSDKYSFSEKLNEEAFTCECIAEKSGFKIVLVKPASGKEVPVYAIRKKVSNAVTKRFRENLIVFVSNTGNKQVWHYTIRKSGKPSLTSEIPYHTGQSPELLFQKLQGVFFDLDEQDNITIIDVSQRVGDSFEKNAKQVVKKFYREFQQQHRGFLKFIKGIKEEVNQEWYASLMLNRLMFCYFIQKKGFLNADIDYLQNKLKQCNDKFGKDKFYSFYRTFLLTLFHKGLGSPSDERTKKETELLGNIPYLNGGLFDEHILEKENSDIEVKDEAFIAVFNFFDEWNWYLDTREHATGNNINPDVIGYIFEQYINDRAQMGAYYTREDITDYISKNCLYPWLIEETARHYAAPFEKGGEFFDWIKKSGDRYIYPAVKHGISWDIHEEKMLEKPVAVPKEIEAGVDTAKPNLLERRKHWNDTAPPEAGLPTEIWREVMERRSRYDELLQTIKKGGIAHINDCITYNLNISQIVLDWLSNTADPKAIKHFYESLTKVSVLDPTCGSGAFLFAALNLLEPLYNTCLMRMHSFVEDEDRQNAADKKTFKNAHDFFRKILADVKQETHPNQDYFIYKSIILRNLYGVDIMNEAVEIAKLRLFLKLVATVSLDPKKPNLGLEPLPDVDFNIRCGNTLIGFANMQQMTDGLRYDIEGAAHLPKIEEQCDLVAKAYEWFKKIQLSYGEDHKTFVAEKRKLQKRLDDLNNSLNTFLAKTYGILDKDKVITIEVKDGKETKKKRVNQYEQWLATHQPFHWLAEYYEIIVQRGGFDVIIGNPPYVEYKDIRHVYLLKQFKTEGCSNLFFFLLERCINLAHKKSELGMIIPLSAFSTDRMIPLIDLLKKNSSRIYNANFSWRPGRLFEGANLQLSILILKFGQPLLEIYSTKYIAWLSETRSELFSKVDYSKVFDERLAGSIPKLGSKTANDILKKIRSTRKELSGCFAKQSENIVFYRRGGLYWKVFVDFETGSSEEKLIKLLPEINKEAIIGTLSSNLWWWYYTITSDCRHLGNRDFETFPFDPREMNKSLLKNLVKFGKQYIENLKLNAVDDVRIYKGKSSVDVISFRVNQSKPIIDEIDKILAQHYGFTEEELDFIINYDIKYRMGLGRVSGTEEDEG